MNPKLLALLKDLADVIEKHDAELYYTNDDDGIHVGVGVKKGDSCCIGWPEDGDVSEIRQIIEDNTK